jgi:hypothetical protein
MRTMGLREGNRFGFVVDRSTAQLPKLLSVVSSKVCKATLYISCLAALIDLQCMLVRLGSIMKRER